MELRTGVEDLKQKERANNLIITGLKHFPAANVVKELNKEMGLKEEAIEYAMKINASGGQDERAKVVFYNKRSKDALYKSRAKLAGKKILLAEDVILACSRLARSRLARSRLAFLA